LPRSDPRVVPCRAGAAVPSWHFELPQRPHKLGIRLFAFAGFALAPEFSGIDRRVRNRMVWEDVELKRACARIWRCGKAVPDQSPRREKCVMRFLRKLTVIAAILGFAAAFVWLD